MNLILMNEWFRRFGVSLTAGSVDMILTFYKTQPMPQRRCCVSSIIGSSVEGCVKRAMDVQVEGARETQNLTGERFGISVFKVKSNDNYNICYFGKDIALSLGEIDEGEEVVVELEYDDLRDLLKCGHILISY